MNQHRSKTIRYAEAGVCVALVLLLLGWFVLRGPAAPSRGQPIETATERPRIDPVALRFPPEGDAARETITNQVAELPTTNAATIYRQAFAVLDTLSQEQKDLIKDWRTNVDASVAAELCEKIQPICDLMHKAAAVSNCDWGVEQPIAPETRLSHLSPCRNLARAAVWSVAHCRTRAPSAAVDDLVASSRLGQSMSPLVVGHLVDLAIQNMVIDSVVEHASVLLIANDTRLVDLFTDANYEEGSRHGFEQEADKLTREIDRLAALPPEEAMRELMSVDDDSAAFQIQAMGLTQAIADMRQAAELEREFAKALELSDKEYRDLLTRVQAAEDSNPFAKSYLPGMDMVVDRTQAIGVKSAMVVAGLAVMQDGADALQSHLDPATGQPFTYTATADGFELQSGYEIKGEPVKLRFK